LQGGFRSLGRRAHRGNDGLLRVFVSSLRVVVSVAMIVLVRALLSLRFAALIFAFVVTFRTVGALHVAGLIAGVIHCGRGALTAGVVTGLVVVHDRGLKLSVLNDDAIDSH